MGVLFFFLYVFLFDGGILFISHQGRRRKGKEGDRVWLVDGARGVSRFCVRPFQTDFQLLVNTHLKCRQQQERRQQTEGLTVLFFFLFSCVRFRSIASSSTSGPSSWLTWLTWCAVILSRYFRRDSDTLAHLLTLKKSRSFFSRLDIECWWPRLFLDCLISIWIEKEKRFSREKNREPWRRSRLLIYAGRPSCCAVHKMLKDKKKKKKRKEELPRKLLDTMEKKGEKEGGMERDRVYTHPSSFFGE